MGWNPPLGCTGTRIESFTTYARSIHAWGPGLEEPVGDFLREGLHAFVRRLIEEEVAAVIGAGRYDRITERRSYPYGSR